MRFYLNCNKKIKRMYQQNSEFTILQVQNHWPVLCDLTLIVSDWEIILGTWPDSPKCLEQSTPVYVLNLYNNTTSYCQDYQKLITFRLKDEVKKLGVSPLEVRVIQKDSTKIIWVSPTGATHWVTSGHWNPASDRFPFWWVIESEV